VRIGRMEEEEAQEDEPDQRRPSVIPVARNEIHSS
jgi:hypothetical protein